MTNFLFRRLIKSFDGEPGPYLLCHICGRPRNEPGQMFCSAVHCRDGITLTPRSYVVPPDEVDPEPMNEAISLGRRLAKKYGW